MFKKLLKLTKDITELYQKLGYLECQGRKNSQEWHLSKAELKEKLEEEKKFYENLEAISTEELDEIRCDDIVMARIKSKLTKVQIKQMEDEMLTIAEENGNLPYIKSVLFKVGKLNNCIDNDITMNALVYLNEYLPYIGSKDLAISFMYEKFRIAAASIDDCENLLFDANFELPNTAYTTCQTCGRLLGLDDNTINEAIDSNCLNLLTSLLNINIKEDTFEEVKPYYMCQIKARVTLLSDEGLNQLSNLLEESNNTIISCLMEKTIKELKRKTY